MSLNSVVIRLMFQKDYMQLSIENFKKNIELYIKDNNIELGLKEIDTTQNLINKSNISNDLIINYLWSYAKIL